MSPDNSNPEQPKPEGQSQPAAPAPAPEHGPAPVPHSAPYQDQPVNQQYFAQPQAAPVQYVVMAQSLKGVRGFLLFFVICFVLAGLGYISSFFVSLDSLSSATNIVSAIFSPFLAVLYIGAAVYITMQKVLGRWLAVAALGTGALYSAINTVVVYVTGGSTVGSVTGLISVMIVGLTLQGLLILYFFASKRVKETLVG